MWLLDTHTLIWTLYKPDRLPAGVRALVEGLDNELLVSDVSVLEIVDKAAKYRLPEAGFSVDKIAQRITELGATPVPIVFADIVASAKLPQHHGDPLDRLLIAQARSRGVTLLSKDGKFKLYDVPVFWQ